MLLRHSPSAFAPMQRRSLIAALATSVALGLSACSEAADPAPTDAMTAAPAAAERESEEQFLARAQAIHDRVITIDTHADINTGNFTETVNYTMNLDTQVNLVKMAAGGLDVAL